MYYILVYLSIGVCHPHLKGISNQLVARYAVVRGVCHPHLKGISNIEYPCGLMIFGVYHPHLKGLFK